MEQKEFKKFKSSLSYKFLFNDNKKIWGDATWLQFYFSRLVYCRDCEDVIKEHNIDVEKMERNALYGVILNRCYSTLNYMLPQVASKLGDPNGNGLRMIFSLINGLFSYRGDVYIDTLNGLYERTINSNLDVVYECTDSKRETEILKTMANKSTDNMALDLISDCYIAFYDCLNNECKGDLLKEGYSTYKDENGDDKETYYYIILRAISKACRKFVESNRKAAADDVFYEDADGKVRKASAISVYSGYYGVTADAEVERLVKAVKRSAKLNSMELYVFNHLMVKQDLTVKEIAKKKGVEVNVVNLAKGKARTKVWDCNAMKEYRERYGVGLRRTDKSKLTKEQRAKGNIKVAENLNDAKAKKVAVYTFTKECGVIRDVTLVSVHSSVGQCAKTLGINKGGISQVLNGEKTTYKGFIFRAC